ncbi:hypothetical protein BDZ88DRAFT_449379 [Geranomyces variabilis]|nr:hypothetical protein BDZ88DRAFT_449379 [Geranomyces variabilis]KAJ3142285.1 hypothetical protein HDU90_004558 [Geranomyces variabilis]
MADLGDTCFADEDQLEFTEDSQSETDSDPGNLRRTWPKEYVSTESVQKAFDERVFASANVGIKLAGMALEQSKFPDEIWALDPGKHREIHFQCLNYMKEMAPRGQQRNAFKLLKNRVKNEFTIFAEWYVIEKKRCYQYEGASSDAWDRGRNTGKRSQNKPETQPVAKKRKVEPKKSNEQIIDGAPEDSLLKNGLGVCGAPAEITQFWPILANTLDGDPVEVSVPAEIEDLKHSSIQELQRALE